MARSSPVNDPATVRREYASEDRFLARRLATWATLDGPLVEDAAIDALRVATPERIVDVGCGTGDFSARVQRALRVDVIAVDLSARMAELAHAHALASIVGDIQALPFADATFDGVLANRVLYHLPDFDRGAKEIRRVLRDRGRLVAVAYAADHLGELWEEIGVSPLAASSALFGSENGAALLAPHFGRVEQRDLCGRATFPTVDAVRRFLAAYGEFSPDDLAARLGHITAPFHATYRHSVFVAR